MQVVGTAFRAGAPRPGQRLACEAATAGGQACPPESRVPDGGLKLEELRAKEAGCCAGGAAQRAQAKTRQNAQLSAA